MNVEMILKNMLEIVTNVILFSQQGINWRSLLQGKVPEKKIIGKILVFNQTGGRGVSEGRKNQTSFLRKKFSEHADSFQDLQKMFSLGLECLCLEFLEFLEFPEF